MPIEVGLAPIAPFKAVARATQKMATASTWTQVVLSTTRFIAPRPCSVLVSGAVMFGAGDGTTSTQRVAAVWKNGTVFLEGVPVWNVYPNNAFSMPMPVVPVDLLAGEFLELQAYSPLANTTLYGDTSGTGSVMSVWEIR